MMAEKRKVANLLALAVLSTVIQRPMHRYEMASVMRARGKDRDMNVKFGSLYTVVKNLEKNGFLEAVETTRQGARPERTVYRITQAGRQELVDWTRELLCDPHTERTWFTAGLSVLAALTPQDAIGLLRTRLQRLTESLDAARAQAAEDGAWVPRLFLVEDEYRRAMAEAEIGWVRSLLDELSSGTFPDLAAWQKWHETGEMPAEFVELARYGSEQQ
jgi:DNA-binding PadR family transcriptional regulator